MKLTLKTLWVTLIFLLACMMHVCTAVVEENGTIACKDLPELIKHKYSKKIQGSCR